MVVHLASFSARPSACESTYAPRQTAELRIWRVLAAVLLPCFLLSRKQHTAGAKAQVLLHLAGVGKDASFCSGGVTAQSAACNPTRRFRLLLLETLRQGAAKYPSNYDIQGSVVTLHYAVAQGLKELGDDDRDPTMHKFIWPILATARSYLKYAVAAAASEPGLLSCADFIIATRAVGTAVRSATSEAPSAAIITAQAEIVQCTDPLLRCLLAIHTHCKDKLLPEQQPATGRAFQRASLHDIVDVLLFNAVYPAGLKRIRSALGVGAAVALLDLAVSSSLPAVAAVWKGELSGRDVWEKKEFSTSAGLLASAFNMLWLATVGEWYEPSTSVGHVIAEGADLGLSAGSAKLPWGPWEAAISDLLASWSQEDIPEPPGAVPLLLQILRASLACDASWRGDPPADLALPFDASFGPELVDRATYALAMHMCRKPSSPATLDSIADFLLDKAGTLCLKGAADEILAVCRSPPDATSVGTVKELLGILQRLTARKAACEDLVQGNGWAVKAAALDAFAAQAVKAKIPKGQVARMNALRSALTEQLSQATRFRSAQQADAAFAALMAEEQQAVDQKAKQEAKAAAKKAKKQRAKQAKQAAQADAAASAAAVPDDDAKPSSLAAGAWQAAGISEDIICCPISQEPMRDPVICADGHTYERLSIEQWLAKHDTSPMTNEVLPTKQLIPNMAVRQLVQAFVGQ
ncbi:hypothetical protein WJX72_011520 [[Myrmecia] bisecta]|uniref:U-box domain-containing protein n=1 Tax=[Myrmecia] bisecta TaxID=41462 RepID=A0AAW1RA11_9CHLO